MRLLDTTTLELCEFFGSDIPYYAILSHRWEDDEVTFQDLISGLGPSRKGYLKVQGCCRKAARDGWRYAWVDSCCIDKSSSAELSEAINSMFQWYRDSQVCYAFLSDVPEGLTIKKHHKKRSRFRKSRWWTRGWTLQELLAPRKVVFYDSGWGEIGTRGYLHGLVHSITGIRDLDNFMQASVARKMSWASKRKTKRVEDQAYCLLGIFNVNMPPLYGEGQKAFERLQLEILKSSDDESIFAWEPWDMAHGPLPTYTSLRLLAMTPLAFQRCGPVMESTLASSYDPERPPFSMTNKGFRMELSLRPTDLPDTFEAPLNCSWGEKRLAIRLRKVENSSSRFHRECAVTTNERKMSENAARSIIFIHPHDIVPPLEAYGKVLPISFEIINDSLARNCFTELEVLSVSIPANSWVRLFEKEHPKGLQAQLQDLDFCQFNFDPDHDASLLQFGDVEGDNFVLILKRDRHARNDIVLDVLIPEKDQSIETFHAALSIKLHINSGSDRMSRRMQSGRTMSIALRKMDIPGGSLSKLSYELDITIDSNGKLRWPDLSDSKKILDGVGGAMEDGGNGKTGSFAIVYGINETVRSRRSFQGGRSYQKYH
ncbi:hypothetical protein IFR05_013488 [Cadophora sp. M221]|nr:hypothetical protein IFR05_013488 [Cadophora sp. M221]